MKRHLHCAEQQVSRSNLTKYCACHAERLTYLVLIAYETSFTVRGATGVTIQPHQILHLPRKMTRLLYRPHIWNVISNARSNRCHFPTSPNTAPATKNDTARCQRKSPKTGETSFPEMRGRSDHDPSMIREWSENDPRMKTQTATRLASEVTFRAHHEHFLLKNTTFRAQSYIQTFTKYCACHEKCHLNFTKYCACHEKWHLNFTKYCACHEKWHLNVTKYCACHEKCHLNVTKYCACHEKWHLNVTKYCACHEKWHLNFTKYCACHEKWHLNFTKYCTCHEKWLDCCIVLTYETSFPMRGATGVTLQPHQMLRLPRKMTRQNFKENLQKQVKRHFQCGADPTMIREWSEHDPRMIRAWKRKPQPASQPRLLFDLTTSIFYCKIQRFAPNLTFKPSPNTAPATKSDTWTSPSTAPATKSDTWTSPSTAPATKSDTWTSPSTAPATKNDSTAVSSSHMKRHFQCAEQQVSLSNLPKYCTCHEKWHCKMSKKISKNRWNVISNAGPIRPWSENDPSMIRAWKRKPQPASQVRLLFELTTSIFYWKIQRFAPNLTFKPSPNTAPAT